MRRGAAGVLLLCLAGLSGCLPVQTRTLRQQADPRLQRAVDLTLPVFVQQHADLCAPAALATVLNGAGRQVAESALTQATYIPQRHGALSLEMLAAVRRQGLLALPLAPDMGTLLDQLDAGRPVLVLMNLALPFWPRWHYAVISGWDPRRREWLLHAGKKHLLRLPMPVFERVWLRAGGFAMIVVDPRHLPQDLPAASLLSAAAILERVHPRAALAAYQQLAHEQPADARIPLLAGNALRTLHDFRAAEQAYRRSIACQRNWQAMNNLADLLQAQGRHQEALAWARQAAALAPQSPASQTLRELLQPAP